MSKKSRKKRKENKRDIAIILVSIIIITLGIHILKSPSITSFVVISKESTFSDDLNLIVNESKNVIWNIRNPGNLISIKATGAISRNGTAKVYIEKGDERVLIFDSTKQLFDVNVEVLPDYKKIFQGDELLIQIVLFNLRGFGSANVNVKYSIKDPIGNIIAAEEEMIEVETQSKFIRKLLIPLDLKPGNYVAFIDVRTPDGLIGTSSDSFEVNSKYGKAYPIELKFLVLGLIGFIILIGLIIFIKKSYKELKKKELKGKAPIDKIQKFKKQLKALESAYKSKFISEASYIKGKKRIEKNL